MTSLQAAWRARHGGLAFGLCLTALGCSGGHPESDAAATGADARVPVRVEAIRAQPFRDELAAPGRWRTAAERIVAAPFAGTLDALTPRAGEAVHAGATVGWMVSRETRAALRGAEALAAEARDDSGRAEAERALALARHDLVRVPLVARTGGVVLRRAAEPGAEVAEGAELLALAAPGDIVFEAHVPALDVARLHVGQRARILTPGRPECAGQVQRVLPAVSAEDQSVLVWLAAAGGAPAGIDAYGEARLALGDERTAIALPDSSVVEDDLTAVTRVAVVDARDRAHWVEVRLGRNADGWHELLAPALPAGTRVIVSGQHGLPDSTQVVPAP